MTVVILYVFTGYGVVASTPPAELAASSAPLSLAIENVLPGIGAVLIAIAALTATGTSTIGCLLGSSRMLYAGAREKAFPAVFAKVSHNSGVPTNAVIFTGVIALGATFISLTGYANAISLLVSAAVFANWLMMAIMNIALVVVRVTQPDLKPEFRYPVNIKNIPILAIFATFACIWILTYIDTVPLLIGISWVVLLTLWYVFYAKDRWDYLDEDAMKEIADKHEVV